MTLVIPHPDLTVKCLPNTACTDNLDNGNYIETAIIDKLCVCSETVSDSYNLKVQYYHTGYVINSCSYGDHAKQT